MKYVIVSLLSVWVTLGLQRPQWARTTVDEVIGGSQAFFESRSESTDIVPSESLRAWQHCQRWFEDVAGAWIDPRPYIGSHHDNPLDN